MDSLIDTIKRYGQACEDSADPRKSFAIRTASHELAEQLLELIEMRVKLLEKS